MHLFSWWSGYNSSELYKLFLKCAQPKRWKAYDGKITEMDTPNILRARELLEIYNSISMNDIPKDERIDVLGILRLTVKVCFIFLFMFSLKLCFPKMQSLTLTHKQCFFWQTGAWMISWQQEKALCTTWHESGIDILDTL